MTKSTKPVSPGFKPNTKDHLVDLAGTKLTLRFSVRAMLCLKDYWQFANDPDMTADGAKTAEDKIDARVKDPSVEDFVTIFWAASRTHHPEMTREDVLELMDEAGLDGLQEIMGKAFSAAAPPPSDKKKAPPVTTTKR